MNGTSPKYQRTHEELKKQALDLFLSKGYEASSIQEITHKTGLSVGAFTVILHQKKPSLLKSGTITPVPTLNAL